MGYHQDALDKKILGVLAFKTFPQNAKANFSKTCLADVLLLIGGTLVTAFFLAVSADFTGFSTYTAGLTTFFLILIAFLGLWVLMLGGESDAGKARHAARIALSPLLILLLVSPYNFFQTSIRGIYPPGVLTIVSAGILVLYTAARDGFRTLSRPKIATNALIAAMGGSFLFFCAVILWRHVNFQDASSFDLALYNQIQWNNLQGNFFQSSVSGSNFVTHNSPFLLLLTPLYALYPHASGLLIIKSLFLTLSAVPFYMIMRKTVDLRTGLPLTIGYLFYPFIAGQHVNAPHEICFLPPFLLFAFYFFLQKRFVPFMLFLLICLSVKEHIALIAVIFGFLSLYRKRPARWVIVPIGLGIFWAVFSYLLILHFQNIYMIDPKPAWLIEDIKGRFLQPGVGWAQGILFGLKTSILTSRNGWILLYTVFSPLAFIFPLLSPLVLFAVPEMTINLLASVPLSYPGWHYNVIVGCSLMIACAAGVKRLSSKSFFKDSRRGQEILAWFLCVNIIAHFFLWWDYVDVRHDPAYNKAMHAAVRLIPDNASVSAPKQLVAYVSGRKDYYLLKDARKGDYVILDRGERIHDRGVFKHPELSYELIYRRKGIRVYRRKKE